MNPAAILALILALIAACHQRVSVTVAGHTSGTSLAVLILAALIAACMTIAVVVLRNWLGFRAPRLRAS